MSNNATSSASTKGAGARSTNNQHADELAPAPPSASSTPSSLTDLPSGAFQHVVSFTDLRTRLGLRLTCRQVRNATTCPLLGLPSEVFQRIVSFADPRTSRLQLCLTCRTALEAVETYSRQVIRKIREEHLVDDTIADRLADQTNLETAITGRQKPVDLPARYLSTVLMTKFLYEFTVPGNASFFHEMVLSPSEGRLAISQGNLGRYDAVHLYDTATKQYLVTLEQQGRQLFFLDENRVLAIDHFQAEQRISCILWSETNRGWRREEYVRIEDYLPDHCLLDPFARVLHHGDKMILFLRDYSAQAEAEGVDFNIRRADIDHALLTVFEINVNSNAGRRLCQFSGRNKDIGFIRVVENKWLLFALDLGGIYAFNLMAEEAEPRCIADDSYPMLPASDCTNKFYEFGRCGRAVQGLVLTDDGVFSNGIQQIRMRPGGYLRHCMAALQSHVLVQNRRKIEMYHAATGEYCYSLGPTSLKYVHGVISKQRNEIFIVFEPESDSFRRFTFQTFCLKEPNIM